jgi:hypothetical protein
MKLKIVHKKYLSGKWYYEIYELKFFFFWVRRCGFFDNRQGADEYAIKLLEDEKEQRKTKKEPPVYYSLSGDAIWYKKEDGEFLPHLWKNHHSN